MTTATYRDYSGSAAELYQRFFVPTIATPASAELLRAAELEPGERVLDIACGTGIIARAAAERVGTTGSVIGVDVAPDMIAVATDIPAGGAPIAWHVADVVSLPLADETVDVVLCQMGLMFMEDKAAALAAARRVLAPGGRIVVNTPGNIQPLFEVMEQAIVENIGHDLGAFVTMVFSMHDPTALAALLRDAGFTDVSSRDYVAALDLPAPAEFMWNYINLTPLGPIVASAPEDAKTAMEQRVVAEWRSLDGDGPTRVEQPMVLAFARVP